MLSTFFMCTPQQGSSADADCSGTGRQSRHKSTSQQGSSADAGCSGTGRQSRHKSTPQQGKLHKCAPHILGGIGPLAI